MTGVPYTGSPAAAKSRSGGTDRHHPFLSAGVAYHLDVIAVGVIRPRRQERGGHSTPAHRALGVGDGSEDWGVEGHLENIRPGCDTRLEGPASFNAVTEANTYRHHGVPKRSGMPRLSNSFPTRRPARQTRHGSGVGGLVPASGRGGS